MPEIPPGNLRALIEALHELHARAGWPSTRELAREHKFSHTAVHELFTKNIAGAPKLTVLLDVVEQLAIIYRRVNVDQTVDEFESRWKASLKAPFAQQDALKGKTRTSHVTHVEGRQAALHETRDILPVYLALDESASMGGYRHHVTAGLEILRNELTAARRIVEIWLSILGFSDDVAVRLPLTDFATLNELPQPRSYGGTAYRPVFNALRTCITQDANMLNLHEGFEIHPPVVVFFTGDRPMDDDHGWRRSCRALTNIKTVAPRIIAAGIGAVDPGILVGIATHGDDAVITTERTNGRPAIIPFFETLSSSLFDLTAGFGNASRNSILQQSSVFQSAYTAPVPQGFSFATDMID